MTYQIDESLADKFKIRCSAIGDIMGGSLGISESQTRELNELLTKSKTKPLTAIQQTKMFDLTEKFNAKPSLSAGAKTYCQKWLKESIGMYNRRSDKSSNRYTEKGLIVEDHAIDFISDMLGFPMLLKNELPRENEYMRGTCDVKTANLIVDNKSSWDFDTFPFFEKKIPNLVYEWQGQGYMELENIDNFKLIYTLMDTPENIILREATSYSYKNGFGELTESLLNEFKAKMTYGNIPNELKIKIFNIKRDKTAPSKIEERVKLCRIYIKELIQEANTQILELSKLTVN